MVTVTPVSTRRGLAAVAAIVALAATWASAQETPAKPPAKPAADCAALQQDLFADLKDVVGAGCTPSPAQIAKLLENPVANFVSIPLQYDYITVKGPHLDAAKIMQRLQVTPTFPLGQGSHWTAIHRLVFPFVSLPLNKGFGDCIGMVGTEILSCPSFPSILEDPFDVTSGYGDMVYAGLVAPKESTKIASTGGMVVWGLGGTAMFPTASEDVLGTGKYSLGPTGVIAYLGKTWTAAVFPQQWWSIGGDARRADVNLTNVQYFIFYAPPGLNPDAAWRIGMSPNISINWAARGDKVTLPIGLGAGRMISIGGLPINVHGEVDYSVLHPGDKPSGRWDARIYITAVIPTFVF